MRVGITFPSVGLFSLKLLTVGQSFNVYRVGFATDEKRHRQHLKRWDAVCGGGEQGEQRPHNDGTAADKGGVETHIVRILSAGVGDK